MMKKKMTEKEVKEMHKRIAVATKKLAVFFSSIKEEEKVYYWEIYTTVGGIKIIEERSNIVEKIYKGVWLWERNNDTLRHFSSVVPYGGNSTTRVNGPSGELEGWVHRERRYFTKEILRMALEKMKKDGWL